MPFMNVKEKQAAQLFRIIYISLKYCFYLTITSFFFSLYAAMQVNVRNFIKSIDLSIEYFQGPTFQYFSEKFGSSLSLAASQITLFPMDTET